MGLSAAVGDTTLAFGLVSGQARVLNTLAIALIPRQGGHVLQPLGRDRGHGVQRGAEGFCDEFEPVEHADGSEHMGRIGALVPTGCQEPCATAPFQHLVQQAFLGLTSQQPIAEFAEDGKVEARVAGNVV